MSAEITIEKLTEIKSKIERTKTKIAELKGQKTSHMESLKTEFKCASLREAEALKLKMEKDIETAEGEIEEASEQLKIDFPQLFSEEE